MRTILAFDTTAGACSVAVRRAGETVAHRSVPLARGHAEALVPMIVETLAGAGLGFSDLDAVAATTGPGAFTGIRIGLAAARGIALAAGIPAIGIGALAALAAGVAPRAAEGKLVLAPVDTKRSDFYAQAWAAPDQPAGEAAAVDADGLAAMAGPGPVLVTGDAARAAAAALAERGVEATVASGAGPPDAAVVAILAERLLETTPSALPPATPVYLRAPEARLPAPRRQPAR